MGKRRDLDAYPESSANTSHSSHPTLRMHPHQSQRQAKKDTYVRVQLPAMAYRGIISTQMNGCEIEIPGNKINVAQRLALPVPGYTVYSTFRIADPIHHLVPDMWYRPSVASEPSRNSHSSGSLEEDRWNGRQIRSDVESLSLR